MTDPRDCPHGVLYRKRCHGRAAGWRTPRSKALRLALRRGFARVRCAGGTSLAFVREA